VSSSSTYGWCHFKEVFVVMVVRVEAEEGIGETGQTVEGARLVMMRDDKANCSVNRALWWQLWDIHYPRRLITTSSEDSITVCFNLVSDHRGHHHRFATGGDKLLSPLPSITSQR
jgi:hypothetical protein